MNTGTLVLAVGLVLLSACSEPAKDASAPLATTSANIAAVAIPVEGLTCASCSTAVRLAIKRIAGVTGVEFDVDRKMAVVHYDASRARPQQMIEAIEYLGYQTGSPVTR
ncbi:MAG: heavy-metal-associated domain-containing protein [Planctomycetes bacterium]|nr:heavy metal-associated domain-containing protein [Nannocystis sp.]MBA3547006.1 heavy-metal-associated domain-containing protein [Nannocystis sp.]MBA3845021.1 heavy-metal-associated domain-containing protein [Planctomycetota bacterium]